jgi:hypothetical protein
MLLLECCRRRVLFVRSDQFLGRGLVLNAVGSAVVGDVGGVDDGCLLDNGPIDVDVGDNVDVHADNRGVVGEDAAIPPAARKANSHVAAAVVDAAVEADVRSPVPPMEGVSAAEPAPVTWGPQGADVGGGHPGTWDPVVTKETPMPVSRRPHQVGGRARRLLINGQGGRRELCRNRIVVPNRSGRRRLFGG